MPDEKEWLKKLEDFIEQKHRLILLLILAFAFIIRLKYMTVNAAVWWDEADYLSLAKHYGLGLPEQAAPWRARAIPMLLGIFYWLGANEWFIRLIEALVSVAGIYLTYLVGKTLFNKAAGLMAALMLSVYFELLFWTARISMDVYALTLWAFIAYLFWKGYTENSTKYYIATGLLYGAGIYAYDSIGFMAIFFLLFLLITEKWKFILNKRVWIMALAALLAVIPFATYNYIAFGDSFGEDTNFMYKIYPRFGRFATADFDPTARPVQEWQRPMSDMLKEGGSFFTEMPYMLKWPFFILLLAGLLAFVNLIIGFDMLLKGKNDNLKKELFILLWILSIIIPIGITAATTAYTFEPRLIFPGMPAVFIVCALGAGKIIEIVKKYSKEAAIIAVILLVAAGMWMQVSFADKLIKSKKDSFVHQNLAGAWLKEHTNPGEPFMLGCGLSVNLQYYSERDFIGVSNNQSLIKDAMAKGAKFYIIDGYDPACAANKIMGPPEGFGFVPVQAFFIDEANTQPIIIIYEATKAYAQSIQQSAEQP